MASPHRNLVLMGSGETSPTMVTPHQKLLKEITGEALVLDTPYGFQENADELTQKIQSYFSKNVGREIREIRVRDKDAEVNSVINLINKAEWLFTGPGSPTYALDVWQSTGIGDALRNFLSHGTLVVSSAAALTVGTHTIPVYEMYKVGKDPHWFDGLNLLEIATGLKAAVVPHFNNAQGGTHDTRFCYIGERRMKILEDTLPDDVFVLGIDEHTGVQFDIDRRSAAVFGKGTMTVRMGGAEWIVQSGSTVSIDEIAAHAGTRLATAPPPPPPAALVENSATIDVATIIAPYVDALLEARDAARKSGNWAEADAIRDRLIELKVTIKDSAAGSSWQLG